MRGADPYEGTRGAGFGVRQAGGFTGRLIATGRPGTPYDLVDAAERLRRTEFPQAATFDVRRPPTEAEMLKVLEGNALR